MKTKIFTLLVLLLTLSVGTAKAAATEFTYDPVVNAPNNYYGASPSLCTWTKVTENGVTFGRFTHPATAAATDGPQWGAFDKSFAIYNQVGPTGTSNRNLGLGTNATNLRYVIVKMRKSTSSAPTLIFSSLTQLNQITSATPVVVGEWVSYLFDVYNTAGINYKVLTVAPEYAANAASVTDIDPTMYFLNSSAVLTLSANDNAMGTVSGSGSYRITVKPVLKATPKPGYRFVNWTEGATVLSTSALHTTAAAMAAARTIVANFAAGYTVTATSNDVAKGTVTGTGGYDGLSAIDVVATAIGTNRFIGWVENGVVVSTSTTYNFTPAADRTLVAYFAPDATNYTSAAPATLTYIYGNTGIATAKGSVVFDYIGTGDVTVSLPSTPSYEISLTNGSGYSDGPIALTADGSSNVPFTTIYVRLKDGLGAGSFPTNLTLTPTIGSPATIALTGSVTKRPIFATGINVTNKIYDQTTAAVLSGGTLSDVLPADVSDVALTTAGTFSDYHAFPLKMVTATLSGAKATNYDLTFSSNATIYPKQLNVGITYTAGGKVYDRTSTITPAFNVNQFSSSSTAAALLSSEVPGAGTATDGLPYTYTVGTGAGQLTYGGVKTITDAGYNSATAAVVYCMWLKGPTLTGGLAGNYVLGVPAYMTPKPLTVAGVNKVYNANTTATTTLTGVVSGDVVTLAGTFDDANIGTAKTVTLASSVSSNPGAGAGGTSPTGVFSYNYSVAASTTTATIYPVVSTWAGTGNWSTPANWTYLPLAATDVVVGSGELTIDQNQTVNSITVNSDAKLTLPAGKSLTTTNFTINSNGTYVDKGTSTTVTGTATVNQALTGLLGAQNRPLWYITTPVSAATTAVFDVATGTNKMTSYDETTTNYVTQFASNTTPLVPGVGYVSYIGGNDATYSFATNTGTNTSKLNTGNVSIPVTRTGVDAPKRGFNLIGNPYPSYLDWAQVSTTNVLPTIWYRSVTGNIVSGVAEMTFDTYNAALNEAIKSSSNSNVLSQFIPPMQAFWVKVRVENADVSGLKVDLTNDMRSHKTPAEAGLLRSSKVNNQKVLRLQVSNGMNSDQALIALNSNAANSFDDYDSPKMSNENAAIPELYTLAGNEKVAINGFNNINTNEPLALGFNTGTANNFKISATEVRDFDANTRIILRDNERNTEQDLTDGSFYSFASGIANTSSRFSIIFKTAGNATGVDRFQNDNSTFYVFRNANNQIAIQSNLNLAGAVTVYNAMGQKLLSTTTTGTSTVINKSFGSGVYFVTIVSAGKKTTNKVILN